MFKSPIDYLKEMIQELVHDFANMAFDWLEIFMLSPTDFSKYPKIEALYDFTFSLSISICLLFVAWSLINIVLNSLAGTQSRSIQEVLFKAIASFVLAASAPWILDSVLLKLNNAIVEHWLNKGLSTDKLQQFIVMPGTAKLSVILAAFIIVILFVILGLQYIQRIGEYIVLLVLSPIAAQSIITENNEIWSVWWREAISVIFSHAFQVSLLWLILNLITDTEKLSDYMFAIGLMIVLLKGPKFLRQLLYSSGAGRTAVGMAGGSAKMTIYKFAAAKMTGK